MSKFGKKFSCWSCATKFYDLGKAAPKCPKCGANPDDDPNKGSTMPATPAFTEEYLEDVEEEISEDVASEEEEIEEELDEGTTSDDY